MRVILGQLNSGVAALNTGASTLTITGLTGFDFDVNGLSTVYNVTQSARLPLGNNIVSVTNSVNLNGTVTTVYTFVTIPAGWGNTDVLSIELNIPIAYAQFITQQYQATSPPVTKFRTLTLTNAAQSVKATAGGVYGYYFINPNASIVYIKFYDTTGAITVGTTPVVHTLQLPASGTISITPGTFQALNPFVNAIQLSAVTGLLDNNTTAPGATIYAEVLYI